MTKPKDPMKYRRWHIRLILEPYGKTCYATKAEAQKEADEIVSRKPALRGICVPVETRCALKPVGPGCIAKMPKELAERSFPSRNRFQLDSSLYGGAVA